MVNVQQNAAHISEDLIGLIVRLSLREAYLRQALRVEAAAAKCESMITPFTLLIRTSFLSFCLISLPLSLSLSVSLCVCVCVHARIHACFLCPSVSVRVRVHVCECVCVCVNVSVREKNVHVSETMRIVI